MMELQESKSFTKTSYSGVDIRVYAVLPGATTNKFTKESWMASVDESMLSQLATERNDSDIDHAQALAESYDVSPQNKAAYVELADIQTLSYSIYRDKTGVNALGQDTPRGFTRGTTVIAGTMIFTVMHERILKELLDSMYGSGTEAIDLRAFRIDQLPPIDIFVSFENEVGNKSRLGILGVEFMNEGQVMSVSDLITENSVNYLAQQILPMSKTDGSSTYMINGKPVNGFQMTDNDYAKAAQDIQDLKKRWM